MERNNKLIATRFPVELIKQLDEVAKKEDRTRSQVLRTITKKYIKSCSPTGNPDERNICIAE